MAARKYKKLTNRQKEENRRFKKQLVDQGILPPPKPKLNRKKFIEDTKAAWNEDSNFDTKVFFIMQAVSYVMASRDHKFKITAEAVGAAKVLAVALKLQEFENKVRAENRKEYKVTEQYDYIREILEL